MVMEEEATGVPEGSRYWGIVICLVRLKNSQKDLKYEIDLECEANRRASKSCAPPTTSDGVGAKLYIKSFRTTLAFLVSAVC